MQLHMNMSIERYNDMMAPKASMLQDHPSMTEGNVLTHRAHSTAALTNTDIDEYE